MPFNIGAPELILIVLVLVLVFGVGKLGDVGAALGKSVREFRSSVKDEPTAKKDGAPEKEA